MTVIAKWYGDGVAAGTALGTSVGSSTDTKFDTVNVVAPNTIKVSANGAYSPRLEWLTNGGSGSMLYSWLTPLGGATFNTHAIRFYLEIAAYSSGNNASLFSIRDNVGGVVWYLEINTGGFFRLRNQAGTTLGISQQPLPLNTEMRIEGIYNNGSVTVMVFLGNHIVPFETLTGTGFNVNATNSLPQKVQFGSPNSTSFFPHLYIDSITFTDTADFIGPMAWPQSIPFRVWDGHRENFAEIYGVWTGTSLKQFVGVELAP
jgi:hypothetical protein